MSRSFLVLVILFVSTIVTACGGSNSTGPSAPAVPFSQTDLRVGTGAEAVSGRQLTVNYTGWLHDPAQPEQKGRQFDSSLSAGRTPFPFVLGAGGVIRGWDQGVVGMRVGGLRRLVIPPELGYGSSGAGSGANAIPPNATLVFDIDCSPCNKRSAPAKKDGSELHEKFARKLRSSTVFYTLLPGECVLTGG